MTKLTTRRIFVMILSLVAFDSAAPAWATPPSVSVTYDSAQDALCAADEHYAIEKPWKDELAQDLPRVHELWNAIGPRLLATTEELTGRHFPRPYVAIRLTLCNVPSESTKGNIKVNMRFALRSFVKEPVPLRYKVSVFYHELLHEFIDTYLSRDSPLLALHASEPERVRDHLHLLALEKAAYLRLGLKEELAEIVKVDGELPNGFYKRAWEIVNKEEATYLKYVDELKDHHP